MKGPPMSDVYADLITPEVVKQRALLEARAALFGESLTDHDKDNGPWAVRPIDLAERMADFALSVLPALLKAAVEREREASAKLCDARAEAIAKFVQDDINVELGAICHDLAAAIRARKGEGE